MSGVDPSPGEATPFLEALRRKAIVGGSSAGAMNQPMSDILITASSSESYSAVASGSVFSRSAGNGFLLSEELADVHFSERGRQGRLIVFAAATRQRLAFGVDENTAYVWRQNGGVYDIVGAGGVVIVVDATGTTSSQTATVHYLTSGDTFDPATGVVTHAQTKFRCQTGNPPTGSTSVFSSTNWRDVSLQTAQAVVDTVVTNYHGSPAVEVQMSTTIATQAWCSNTGAVSFEGLTVRQFARSTHDNAAATPDLPQDFIWPIDT